MEHGEYCVFVGNSLTVRPVLFADPMHQITHDLDAGPVIVVALEADHGAVVCTARNDPVGGCATGLPRPRLAQRLVDRGPFWDDDEPLDVRGGLWVFGPGYGWSYPDAIREARRLRRVF